jgi:hypothetical protein
MKNNHRACPFNIKVSEWLGGRVVEIIFIFWSAEMAHFYKEQSRALVSLT